MFTAVDQFSSDGVAGKSPLNQNKSGASAIGEVMFSCDHRH